MKRRHLVSSIIVSAALPRVFAQSNDPEKVVPRAGSGAKSAAKASATKAPQKLVFGLITPRNPELTLKNWTPFIERMSQTVGVPIEARTFASQGDLVKEFLDDKVDLAWLGNAPALDIIEAGKGNVFAAMVVQGKTAYRSVLITQKDSTLRSLEDVNRLAGQLTFGDGDVKSTSGHIVPRYFAFVKKGINDPEKQFKEVKRSSHEGNILAVIKRDVDVATNNTSELDNFRRAKPDQAGLIRVIWESPDIPESPLVMRTTLPADLRAKVAGFTYKFGTVDDEEKGILWNINNLTALRKSTNRQLLTIADLEMFNARQRVMNDTKITTAERQQKVDEITKRGSKLELLLKRTG